jgi:ComF family protein
MAARNLLESFRRWSEVGLDLAFPWPASEEEAPQSIQPPFCRRCGYPFPALADQPDFLCHHCAEKTFHFEWARAGYLTAGQVREAVVGFKYGEQFFRREQLIGWLVEAFDRHGSAGRWDGLVPVPLYPRRYRARGFNQARELAEGLKSKRKMKILDCLYRCRDTPTQTSLTRKARWENLEGAFQLKARFDVRGLNLLIIDDVFTTGATANSCALALRNGGADRVAVLTVARS